MFVGKNLANINLGYHDNNFISIIFFYWYRFIRLLVNDIASSYGPIIPEAIYNIIRNFYLAFGNFWDNEQKNPFLNCDGSTNTRNITYPGAVGGPSHWILRSTSVAKSHSASRRQVSTSFRMQRQLYMWKPTTEFSFRSSVSMRYIFSVYLLLSCNIIDFSFADNLLLIRGDMIA